VELAHMPEYFVFFVGGTLAYETDFLELLDNPTGLIYGGVGLVLGALVFVSAAVDRPLYAWIQSVWPFYEALMGVALGLGTLVLYRNFFNWSNRFTRFLFENSYAVYIVHFPIVIAIHYLVEPLPLGPVGLRWLSVWVVAAGLSYVVSALLRRNRWVRMVL
jgi:glucan biosynthesis protein C